MLFASTAVFDAGLSLPGFYTVRLDGLPPVEILSEFVHGMERIDDWNWYPDSERVSLLGSTQRGGEGIYTVPVAGGPAVLLRNNETSTFWTGFQWGRSPSTLYLSKGGSWDELSRNSVDTAAMRIVASEPVTAGTQGYEAMAVSPDERRVAVTIGKRQARLWSVPLDSGTGRIAGEEGEPLTDAESAAHGASLSRDGTRLAYTVSHAGTGREQFWILDLTTMQHRRLADDDQGRDAVVWSPDGKLLAYVWSRGEQEHAPAVRWMDSNEEQLIAAPHRGGGPRGVSDPWVGVPSDWSPDGRAILASSHLAPASTLGLWPIDAAPHAETAVKVLTSDADSDLWEARYSPDGRWIAFLSNDHPGRPGESVVFVIPGGGAPRSQWTAVTEPGQWADKPRWSPDGSLVYYIKWEGVFWNVWATRFDTRAGRPVGAAFPVTHFSSARHEISRPFQGAEIGIGPRRLIVPISETTGSIWLIDSVGH